MKKKKIYFLVRIILLCFLIYNIIWFTNWCSYNKYKEAVGYEESTSRFFCEDEEGYRYAVFAPDYLRFVGNLSVGNNVWGDECENSTCSLIIWPLPMGGYEFGVNVNIPVKSDDGFAYNSYSFLLDEEGRSISDELSKEEKNILKENNSLIKKTYQKAYDMWKIGGKYIEGERDK